MSDNTITPSRRNFLKTMGLSIPVIGISGFSLHGCVQKRGKLSETLYQHFKQPEAEARPFFRWWWNGNQVNREEISREILLMKEAGAGGIEINPIAMPQQLTDPQEGGLEWLSASWCEMVKYTSAEAGEQGMITDLIVGTGWPFGGEFLEPEETIQGLTVEKHEVSGPGMRSVSLREALANEEIYRVSLIPKALKAVDALIVTDQRPDHRGLLHLDVPEGDFLLVVIRIKKGFREVFRGAPGGAGPVLDHFNAGSVARYLNNMSEHLSPHFDGQLNRGLRAMFCDSIELEGANWTSDLMREFNKRRGYDAKPYLPLLLIDDTFNPEMNEILRQVRYDYSKTLAELFKERFVGTFHQWCRQNKVLSRYQAYGHPWLYTDLVEGYMIPDIPEGDQWLYNPGWSNSRINEIRYAIWNKYASSGGHLAGRSIISSEAMTNTSGVFRASLDYLKQAADLNFVAGINHLVLHGFNYSPPEAGFPGWVQYGTYFNEHNPWWPYVSHFMTYASRISALMQQCQPVSQVAIMGPTPDIWQQYGLDRNPFNTEPWYLHSLWQSLSNHGISSDYINGQLLQKSVFRNGNIQFGKMNYQVLIVCDMESIEEPDAISLLQYIEAGGKVVFLGKTPSKSAGLHDRNTYDRIINESMDKAIAMGAHVRPGPGEKEKGSMKLLMQWTGQLIRDFEFKNKIEISDPDPLLFTSQFSYNNKPVVFITNVNTDKDLRTNLSIRNNSYDFWKWDPESGEKEILEEAGTDTISITLNRLESMLIVLDKGQLGKKTSNTEKSSRELLITGTWEVSFQPVLDMPPFTRKLSRLEDISHLEGLENFSGTATYSRVVNLEDTGYNLLDAGTVFDLAEVMINDQPVGTRWYGKKIFRIQDHLVKGENRISIKVTNTLFNYCLSQTDNPEIAYWINRSRQEKRPLPAGLIGPVRLTG